MSAVKVGLIGAGRIGTHHAGILARLGPVTSLVIADAMPGRARDVASATPEAHAVDVDGVFTRSDAVVIASSTDTHAEFLLRAAASGVTTFCEKPIALDLESTREAVSAVESAGITVQMGFQRRYDPAMRAVRDRVTGGELGIPYLVRSQTHDPSPPPLDYIPVSGGIFKDCLIHDIDIVRYVTGQEVVSVTAYGSVAGHPEIAALGDYGTATAMLEMSGGTLAQISGMRHDPVGYDVRLEVFAPGDSVAAGWSERTPIRSAEPGAARREDPIISFWDRFDAAYRAEMEAFVEVVAGRQEPASGPQDAYEALRIATACDLSAAERRTVHLEEVR